VSGWHEGVVTAYRIRHGELQYIDKQATRGSITAHVSFDRTGRWLFAANYRMGVDGLRPPQAVVVFPIEADGGLGAPASSVGHTGHGPNRERQEGPHPHCAVVSPDNRFVLVADLGIDRIVVYRFDADTGALAANDPPFAQMAPGSGPRHLVFHPSHRFVHVTDELASSVSTLSWDATSGALTPIQTASALPAGAVVVNNTCSDIGVSADGRFLYAANRGHDSIAVFAVDAATGRLTLLANHPTLGGTPRQFTLDPAGRFLLVANQGADRIVVLARDANTGLLRDSGQFADIGTPMCVKLAKGEMP
jgi:6-phosphogluconolactonase